MEIFQTLQKDIQGNKAQLFMLRYIKYFFGKCRQLKNLGDLVKINIIFSWVQDAGCGC